MKKIKKFIALIIIVSLIFTCMVSASVVYAEDENEDEVTGETTTGTDSDEDNRSGYYGLVGYWNFDTDFKDYSGLNNHGTKVGNISFVPGIRGKAAKFDGKSYIEVKDSDTLDLRKSFTISFWVYKDDMRGKDNDMSGKGVPYLVKMNDEEQEDYPYIMREWWTMEPGIGIYDGEESYSVEAGKQVDIQKWTLVTATYDGETMKIYHDKELVKSSRMNAEVTRSSGPLYIGFANFMNQDNFFKGIMDDLRILDCALTYEEVENYYDVVSGGPSNYLLYKRKGLVAYYKFDSDVKDYSGLSHNGTAMSPKGISFVDAIVGKGAKFNGSSYIEVKDSDYLDLDKGFTIGAWVYKDKSSKNQPILAKYGESHDKSSWSYRLQDINGGYQRLDLADFAAEGSSESYDSGVEIPNGRWYYYAATYDGETLKIYINGVLKKTQQFEGDISNSSGPLWIGGTTDSIFFKGILDDMRIYNFALTPEEVKILSSFAYRIVVDNKGYEQLKAMKVGQSVSLKVERVSKVSKSSANITKSATYKSSNTKVVTVSKGVVKAVGKGKATISITDSTSAYTTLNVEVK